MGERLGQRACVGSLARFGCSTLRCAREEAVAILRVEDKQYPDDNPLENVLVVTLSGLRNAR